MPTGNPERNSLARRSLMMLLLLTAFFVCERVSFKVLIPFMLFNEVAAPPLVFLFLLTIILVWPAGVL